MRVPTRTLHAGAHRDGGTGIGDTTAKTLSGSYMNDIHLAEQGCRVLNVWERHRYVLTRTAIGITGIGAGSKGAPRLGELVSITGFFFLSQKKGATFRLLLFFLTSR